MDITRVDRIRMERAHVLAWPALHTAVVDGWLWRCSGGGSRRANSVSTVDFTGDDMAAAIDTAEARYQGRGEPARFQTFDDTNPSGLAEVLQALNYKPCETTVTMFRPNQAGAVAGDVECRDRAWSEWTDVYLAAITENRRGVNSQILEAVPRPRMFLGVRREGRIVATALCTIGFGCAVIECVATDPTARRQGCAQAALAGVLAWASGRQADLVGLQVVHDNAPAIRLYERLGFVRGAENRFWERGGVGVNHTDATARS